MTQNSEKELYQSKFNCQSSLSVGTFQNCWLTLSQSEKTLEGVQIFIEGGMPAHQHGLPTSPKIVWSKERKVYIIQGLKFSMPGQWKLSFKVNAKNDALKDEISLLLEVN